MPTTELQLIDINPKPKIKTDGLQMLDINNKSNIKSTNNVKLVKKNNYKKIRDLKRKKAKKMLKLSIGTVLVFTSVFMLKENVASSSKSTTDIIEIIEEPIPVMDTRIANSKNINTDVEIITENEFDIKNNIKTYDFSYSNRKNDIVTRTYKVDNLYENLLTNDLVEKFIKYDTEFGIDPYLHMALCMQESSLNQDVKSLNPATGICQIENSNIGSKVVAYNYVTQNYEEMLISNENVNNIDTNIKIGAMLFQNKLIKYNDLSIALQSYNYGSSCIDMLIRISGIENPTYNELKPYIEGIHDNPQNYLNNWNYKTYGDKNYASNVLRYLPGNYTYYNLDSSNINLCNADTNETIGTYSFISRDEEYLMLKNNSNDEIINLVNSNCCLKDKGYSK